MAEMCSTNKPDLFSILVFDVLEDFVQHLT